MDETLDHSVDSSPDLSQLEPNFKNQVVTFGCRLNTLESQIISNNLEALGRRDVIVVHTCSVTKEAEKKSMMATAKLLRDFPDKQIIVTGCAAQLNPDKYLNLGVNRVIGNADKLKPESYAPGKTQKIWQDLGKSGYGLPNNPQSSKPTHTYKPEFQSGIVEIEGRTRGMVQIQNGCDHDCTFCVIHIARGANKSVEPFEIVSQVKALVSRGYKEVVLTGVDITDYGKDLSTGITFSKLIKKILQLVPALARLRLSSIDVAELDEEFFEAILSPRLMPYFHLSLQSANDVILKRMKRRHLRQDIENFCARVMKIRPEATFGADIIAGFPTETEEMFQDTASLVKSWRNFMFLHVFPFSAHEETPASRMPQVKTSIIRERAQILREIGIDNRKLFLETLIGSNLSVLFEDESSGRTSQFLTVKLDTQKAAVGLIKDIYIKNLGHNPKNKVNPFYLVGEIVE